MHKSRLEAFSDGVLAIVITIMVLELKAPASAGPDALLHLVPELLAYVLSFVYVGIYWNNHHHMFQSTHHVNGAILWANLHLLFWLSLFPFATAWMGSTRDALPAAVYGFVLLMAACAYYVLQSLLIRSQGPDSVLARAVGRDWKGKVSPLLYLLSLPAAFFSVWISTAIYVLVAAIWLMPDPRIERALAPPRAGSNS